MSASELIRYKQNKNKLTNFTFFKLSQSYKLVNFRMAPPGGWRHSAGHGPASGCSEGCCLLTRGHRHRGRSSIREGPLPVDPDGRHYGGHSCSMQLSDHSSSARINELVQRFRPLREVGWLLEVYALAISKVISGWIQTCDSVHL